MSKTTAVSLALKGDLLTGVEWSAAQVQDFLRLAADVKARPGRYRGTLDGKSFVLLFEKPSLRTRVTFEVAIAQLGGYSTFLDHTASRLGEREPVRDIARNLERWVQGIIARVFAQRTLDELAKNATIPVINALSDKYHPCQALADFFTLEERFGGLRGLKLSYVGDGNNMCHSLLMAAAQTGAHMRVATPEDYEPDASIVSHAKRIAQTTGSNLEIFTSPQEAVRGSQAVYTDVWASMGQEGEAAAREAAFMTYQVNEALFSLAAPDAVFLHCLPAHRGLEVTDAVMDSPRSVVYDQAENRLHVQKAILHSLLSA
ncbi:MAG TPA: ornithine carbamoyltransferase [Candidatus Binatia bacterium]|nr:ornithine carbamoyltransferase [Candidatus Binatia bacterium]